MPCRPEKRRDQIFTQLTTSRFSIILTNISINKYFLGVRKTFQRYVKVQNDKIICNHLQNNAPETRTVPRYSPLKFIFLKWKKANRIIFMFIKYHYILLVLILAGGDCLVNCFIQSPIDIANSYGCSSQLL